MIELNEILLIDDSKGANALNKRLLQEMGVGKKITTLLNGQLALEYLVTKDVNGQCPCPDIIFLDINMPVMDGYKFLEEYELLKPNQKLNKVIVMLTTSTSEFDIVRANINVEVNNYQIKPLTEDKVFEIINQVEKLGQ
ncbi:MAG: CheY-like chemotaxis protein [Vicingaceae bacterium]|jgi:CheY-like chemotaxis protein